MRDLATTDGSSARVATPEAADLEQFRVELTGYCYRMLGSGFEAEDAVQDTMVRAWKSLGKFEGRSALRSWMYRIATNVCLDMLDGRKRRARPIDLSPAATSTSALAPGLPEATWLEPMPDSRIVPQSTDPADLAASKDSVRLAFVAALQYLAPRQRAVLILREVLAWKASEVAELLGTTVVSVNSALQRARATLAAGKVADTDPARPMDSEQQALLARYISAFESFDLDALTALLHEDATLSMPPYELWFRGPADIYTWMSTFPGNGCRGSKLIPALANGTPAFGQYRPSGPGGGFEPWALQVIEMHAGRIVGLNSFLDTERLFPLFGLPPVLGS